MALAKYSSQFDDISFSEAVEQNYEILVGKNKLTKNVSIQEVKDYIDGSANHLLITARKQNDSYIVDRSYSAVSTAIENSLTPVLRVYENSFYEYFGLIKYSENEIVFGAPIVIREIDSTQRAFLPTFTYTPNSFEDTTTELSSSAFGVDIGYIEA